ncbi:MAG: WbuC family cupin fold metalloprotein [Bacteroidota bacterium]
MIRINQSLLTTVSKEAAQSLRKRKNYNFHKETSDPIQRLLNAMEPGTYVCPHKHEDPDKREVFFILKGKAAVIEFDEEGNITDHEILDPIHGRYAAEIPARVYHTIVCLEAGTVAYEVKDGPYSPADDKSFAAWAPQEGSEKCDEYLNDLLKKI